MIVAYIVFSEDGKMHVLQDYFSGGGKGVRNLLMKGEFTTEPEIVEEVEEIPLVKLEKPVEKVEKTVKPVKPVAKQKTGIADNKFQIVGIASALIIIATTSLIVINKKKEDK